MATDFDIIKEIIEELKNELNNERELTKCLKSELRHICIQNIKLRMHMNILVKTPACSSAEKIHIENGGKPDFSNSIIYFN
jgi:predicted DNA-binding ribbon-helix-helix protein